MAGKGRSRIEYSVEVLILDGPIGTELLARGVPTPLPGWSAHAIDDAPETIAAIHHDYAQAGAVVHTTNTFRTTRRVFGERWEPLARRAVELVRQSVPPHHRVAGSIAPLEDCYRPDLSPPDSKGEHSLLANVLADAGCDLILCETFPHIDEGLAALDAALETGKQAWLSFTPGPAADLLSPQELAAGARRAVAAGASAVLVNCVPAVRAIDYVRALAGAVDVPIGVYANAGSPDDEMGWHSEPGAPERYADLAAAWRDAGASIIGGCCGTGVEHIRAVAKRLATTKN